MTFDNAPIYAATKRKPDNCTTVKVSIKEPDAPPEALNIKVMVKNIPQDTRKIIVAASELQQENMDE